MSASVARSRSLRLGVLGAARILPGAVLSPAADVPDVVVTAIAARDRERATALAAEHGIDRVHDDYDALLADPEIDAVYVPTPASLHGRWIRRAIEAGKHVLVEKPFTANGDEAAEIASIAATSGLVVMEAMHSQHHPSWAQIRALLDEGAIGDPVSVEATFLVDIRDRDDIRWREELGGGALMDLGVYPLRFVQAMFGNPEVRSATALEENGVDASMSVRLELPGGLEGTVRASMVHPEPEARARVVGTRGTLIAVWPYIPHRGGAIFVERDGEQREESVDPTSSYTWMLRAFTRAVLYGGPVVTDAPAAVTTMRAIDAAYTAAGMSPRRPTAD
ncbi:Gfo/Idh/MocA family oxidoreductase [Pengzhenrongella sp.]|uniref:Gfo/Idh/MocA family protein n=1 Tax=Pengzhenrongella sp. TaxID=2888820 RepID=UPI002F936D9D